MQLCYLIAAAAIAALSLFSDERRREAESFVFSKDRKLSAVAGLFFRYVELKYGVGNYAL